MHLCTRCGDAEEICNGCGRCEDDCADADDDVMKTTMKIMKMSDDSADDSVVMRINMMTVLMMMIMCYDDGHDTTIMTMVGQLKLAIVL